MSGNIDAEQEALLDSLIAKAVRLQSDEITVARRPRKGIAAGLAVLGLVGVGAVGTIVATRGDEQPSTAATSSIARAVTAPTVIEPGVEAGSGLAAAAPREAPLGSAVAAAPVDELLPSTSVADDGGPATPVSVAEPAVPAAGAEPAVPVSAAEPTGPVSAAEPTGPVSAPATTAASTATTEGQSIASVPVLLAGVLDVSELPVNYSVFSAGTMYTFGVVGSAEGAQAVTSKFAAVVPVEDGFVVEPGGPPPTGIVYVPSGVLFASGSAVVGPEFQSTLDLATAFMQFFPQVRMTIIGHTDSVGADAENLELSRRRAATAARYIADKGVDPSRVVAEGRGETDPVAANDSELGRAGNRRIEFVLEGLLDSAG